jgi:hypothetical protein
MRNISIFFLMMLAFATASAQDAPGTYYRSTMPDGSTVLGDKPVPGAKSVKKIPLPSSDRNSSTPPVSSDAGASGTEGGTTSTDDAIQAADTAVAEAKQRLDAAKAALAAAQEPLPGERTGNTNGFTRLNDDYFNRVKSYEDAVKSAQQQYDEAVGQRNALRP